MTSQLMIGCPCLFGLESVLAGEIRRMGGEEVEVQDGRVTFRGDLSAVYRANLMLRTAERVLIDLGSFPAKSFEELFQGVKALPLEDWIGKDDAFPVTGWSIRSGLHSVPDCQSIAKKAAVERLKQAYGVSWFEETGPQRQIRFSILRDQVTVSLDTSGPALYKRGYRLNATLAPIKETLAAGIVDLSRVRENTVVVDPFCGSGTLVIEAALHALRIPPGINRRFQFERWEMLPATVIREMRDEAIQNVKRGAAFRGFGSDIDPSAVALCRENAAKAGVVSRIRTSVADIKDFVLPEAEGRVTVIMNPPYGERLLTAEDAKALTRTMGRVLDTGRANLSVISADEDFEEAFGQKANKRRKLYNGMIRCQLYQYFV